MIQSLKIKNIGPASEMTLEFGQRLNILTGDNGLGKSFLLDIIWWVMTRKWPAELNYNLTAGKMALPADRKNRATIDAVFSGSSKTLNVPSQFIPEAQKWTVPQGRPPMPGFIFYALADGSFAVWDPARNYWKSKGDLRQGRAPAYVFSPKEVWDGLQNEDGGWICNGLIRDWASWQKEKGRAFELLSAVLGTLSPSGDEAIIPGDLTRISLDDVRDMPTLRMPYGQDVAVVHASSGMRRIIALAYFLVWCWEEHLKAKELLGEQPENKSVFLIDEVESHLHPKWQRVIIPSLNRVMNKLVTSAEVQIITATHSPLIMASIETLFDSSIDAWFDLDMIDNQVILTKCEFEKYGDVSNWLLSNAFDLHSSRSVEAEQLINEASALLIQESPSETTLHEMNARLVQALGVRDEFLFRWRAICDKKGWLK